MSTDITLTDDASALIVRGADNVEFFFPDNPDEEMPDHALFILGLVIALRTDMDFYQSVVQRAIAARDELRVKH